MKKIYKMSQQLALGEKAENHLDCYFIREFDIWKAAPEEQRRGIDRWFKDRSGLMEQGRMFSVEYKSDFKAAITGNFFIEVESVEEKRKRGWLTVSQAEFFIFFIPQMGVLYWVSTKNMRLELNGYMGQAKPVICQNEDYHSEGFLVNVHTIARLGRQIIVPRLEV